MFKTFIFSILFLGFSHCATEVLAYSELNDNLIITSDGTILETSQGLEKNVLGATTGVVHVTVQVSPFVTASQNNLKVTVSNGTTSVTKTVGRVSQENANGLVALSLQQIGRQIQIVQGSTSVLTSLPVQLNAKTHMLSVITVQSGLQSIFILPGDITPTLLQQGLVINPDSSKNTLVEERGKPVYIVSGKEKGKVLGLVTITSAVQVRVSAQTGTVEHIDENFFFSMLRTINNFYVSHFHQIIFLPLP